MPAEEVDDVVANALSVFSEQCQRLYSKLSPRCVRRILLLLPACMLVLLVSAAAAAALQRVDPKRLQPLSCRCPCVLTTDLLAVMIHGYNGVMTSINDAHTFMDAIREEALELARLVGGPECAYVISGGGQDELRDVFARCAQLSFTSS